ncbi:hypothetical protein IU444_23580 [Nocardia farcinica]|uniref:hypothetical protein n=1 Tax=Nocardia farcinica TaxID=37329 RepID=UPI0018950A94|nr:hypothetical protein [Nocardia farcinica]MBF6387111.1 hypothetical protein [Nocardia farcinica]
MTVLDPSVAASPAHDTPTTTTTEVVARSVKELEALLSRPRTEGEPLLVWLAGPAAAELFGVGVAVTVAATGGEAVRA